MIGFIATIFTTVAYIPQLITIIKTKRVNGISPKTYFILILGLVFWCIHATIQKDWMLLISSSISLIQCITIIIFFYIK